MVLMSALKANFTVLLFISNNVIASLVLII